MATYLPSSQTISYNGYTLGGPRKNVDLSIRNVRDQTNRYTTHAIFTYNIEAWLTGDADGTSPANTSAATTHLETLRGQLSQDGGALVISGFGYGDIDINSGSKAYDVAWGPKILDLRLRPIGTSCVVASWVVEVAVKVNASGVITGVDGNIKEYSYSVSYTINPNGTTVKTVSGRLEIFTALPKADRNIRGLTTTADDFRERVKVPLLKGFMRKTPQQYKLSENGCVLEFSVTDTERIGENAYPQGVAEISFNHTARSELTGPTGGFNGQENSFHGSVKMAKPYSLSYGWEKVLLLIQERLAHMLNKGSFPIIRSIMITEDVFERALSFSVDFWLIDDKSGLKKFITRSGLFTIFNSTSDAAYEQSMALPWDQRGLAGLNHDPQSNKMVDETLTSNQTYLIREKIATQTRKNSLGAFVLRCPPIPNSYIVFENFIDWDFLQDVNVISQMPIPLSNTFSRTGFDPNGQPLPVDGQAARHQSVQSTGDSQPRVEITIRGRAYRVGYQIEYPDIVSVMGNNADFISPKRKVSQTIVGYYNETCPIYAGTWSLTYAVKFDSLDQLAKAIALGFDAIIFRSADVKDPKNKVKVQ